MNKAVMFLGMGFELVAMCMGGFYLGDTINRIYGWTGPTSAYIIVVLMIAWFVHLIYLLRRFQKEMDEDEDGNGQRGSQS